MAQNTPGDPDYIGYTGDVAPTPTPQRRFNTTPAWQNPYQAPQPGDPYYAEWRAANPGIPESAADPIGNQVDVYGNPYGKPQGTVDPGTGGGGGGTPPPTGLGPLLQPWGGHYTPPAPVNLGGPTGIEYVPPVPTFTPPKFTMPTADDLFADPSYQLRKQEGEDGVVNSAAAKGLVRSGGDLSDILKYNQGFASNEYGNVVDRKFRQFATDYQGAADAFAPQMDQWRTQGAAGQHQNELNNDQAWAQYLEQYREFDDQRKFAYGSLSDQQRIGLDAATR